MAPTWTRRWPRRRRRARSTDPAAIAALLDRSLARSSREHGEPVQFIGQPHTPETYAAWRAQQLRQLPGAGVPTLRPVRWPLVLWALKPSAVARFMRSGHAPGLYTPPEVFMFPANVNHANGLAAAIGGYLEKYPGPYRIAPPILYTTTAQYRRAHVMTLDREWTLPASKAIGVIG
ncbi:MAG: hypothetical protein ACHQC8_01930 [Solirubrobacterales bacterium]